jgi:hypothetical protein
VRSCCLLGLLVCAFPASAQESRTVKIETPKIEQQKASQWCWAASIQNCLAAYDVKVEQEKIVQATWGRVADLPAYSPVQAVENLLKASALVAPKGKVVHPFLAPHAPGNPLAEAALARNLVRELEREKSPVMVWYKNSPAGGHVVVCSGVTYIGPADAPRVTQVLVKDPFSGSEVSWPAADLGARWTAAIYLRVAPKPPSRWVFKGVRFTLSPTFDVLMEPSVPVGRVWYHLEDQEWHVWNSEGKDRGPLRSD